MALNTKASSILSLDDCQPVQVKLAELQNFQEYEVLASTARYLLVRGQTGEAALETVFPEIAGLPMVRRTLPAFWVAQVRQRLTT
jgi:hypothetical protein